MNKLIFCPDCGEWHPDICFNLFEEVAADEIITPAKSA